MLEKRPLENVTEQTTTISPKKLKPSRTCILVKDYLKWSSIQVIGLLKKNHLNISYQKQLKSLKQFNGSCIHNIIKQLTSSNNSVEFVIKDLMNNRDFEGLSETICTFIVYWIRDSIIPLLGYDEWSSEEVLQVLEKKKLHGGANISRKSFQPLMDLNFNGNHLDVIADHLDDDDNAYENIIIIIQESLKTEFNDEIKQMMKLIISWVEAHLVFKDHRDIHDLLTVEQADLARIQQIDYYISTSDMMQFLGENQIETALSILEKRIEGGTLRKKGDKTQYPIPFFTVSPGMDKTARNAFEFVETVKKLTKNTVLKQYLDFKVELFVQLSDSLALGSFDCDKLNISNNFSLESKVEEMITARLYDLFEKYFKIPKNNHKNTRRIIDFAKHVKEHTDCKQFTIVIVIDEYQFLTEYDSVTQRSAVDVAVNILGGYCSQLAELDILFIPIFSGISTRNEKSIIWRLRN